MEDALSQLERLASTADPATRRALMITMHKLAYSLEDAHDTINRLGYLHLQTAAVKIGFDLGLFDILVKAEGHLRLEQIAEETKANVFFIERYLRYLAGIGVIAEVAQFEYAANQVTKNLTQKVAIAGISHCFETIGPEYQALPEFMRKIGYQNPEDELHTACQAAWNTEKHQFDWFSDHPENLKYFNHYMAYRRNPETSWLSVYPVEEYTKGWNPDRPVYVNIGGGIGHQCAQFKDKYPHVPGRVILQDLTHSIENAVPTPGVENMAHNFFEPQPVKGARFYFTRGVLHNHPDHKVKLLLKNIMSAMTSDSIILLDEWVLPETQVSAYAACMDLTMMAAFAGMERSERHWRQLLESVGLKLVQVYSYSSSSYECVMDVRIS